ncbi:hypothetical protein BB560_006101 [Smittium megazygosporum]|uniref:Uncharacterized protein n=1 Tax=Smittium megazygosporum TaxID=133381 RepID=A0A2T9YHT1_9FUNG|nr:hypothetical protein BB560_006101 [Smittium megazygosporum]
MNFQSIKNPGRVEVVDASTINDFKGETKVSRRHNKKRGFLASVIGNLNEEGIDSADQGGRKGKKNDQESIEDEMNDKELMKLLKSGLDLSKLKASNMANELAPKSGKERLKQMEGDLEKLGFLNKKSKNKNKSDRMPRNMFYGIQEARNKRAEKKIDSAREEGLLTSRKRKEIISENKAYDHKSIKHKRKNRKTNSVRLDGSGFSGGVLYVPKSKIKNAARQTKK